MSGVAVYLDVPSAIRMSQKIDCISLIGTSVILLIFLLAILNVHNRYCEQLYKEDLKRRTPFGSLKRYISRRETNRALMERRKKITELYRFHQ